MKRWMKNKKAWLTATAVVLIGGMSVPGAMAYFTTYTEAAGGYKLELGHSTDVDESVDEGSRLTKHIQVKNTGKVDAYVRAKVLAGDQFKVLIGGSGKWTKGDGDYYYYSEPLAPEAVAEELTAEIDPNGYQGDFNVAVVQECTPVLYDKDGKAYADWSLATAEEGSGN